MTKRYRIFHLLQLISFLFCKVSFPWIKLIVSMHNVIVMNAHAPSYQIGQYHLVNVKDCTTNREVWSGFRPNSCALISNWLTFTVTQNLATYSLHLKWHFSHCYVEFEITLLVSTPLDELTLHRNVIFVLLHITLWHKLTRRVLAVIYKAWNHTCVVSFRGVQYVFPSYSKLIFLLFDLFDWGFTPWWRTLLGNVSSNRRMVVDFPWGSPRFIPL